MHPFLEILFAASKNKEPTSDKSLAEVKEIIKKIPVANALIKQEATVYQEIKKSFPEIKLNIPQEISINIQDQNGDTPLIWAANQGHEEIVKALIVAKADLDIKNNDNDTALIRASRQGHGEIVRALIAERAKLDTQGDGGFTALICAVVEENIEIMQALFAAGANLNIMDNDGDTALSIAIQNEQLPIVNLLLNAGAMGDPKELYEFLENCDPRDPDVSSALQVLCQQQRKTCSEEKNHGQKLNEDDYQKAKAYLKKLKNLEKLCINNDESRKTLFNIIDENINIEIKETDKKKKMPEALINLITDYYHPPLVNLPFFKASDIDYLLVDNSLSVSKKRK